MRLHFSPSMMTFTQGGYYVALGMWPLLSMSTFLGVAGPKTDLWLVRTMALLVTAVGISLLLASRPGQLNPAVVTLAVGSAAALGWTDAYYSLTGIIWPVYLLDGVVQLALLLGWTFSLFVSKRQ